MKYFAPYWGRSEVISDNVPETMVVINVVADMALWFDS